MQLRKVALETATSILQIRQRAEQEIRRANEILQKRTKELAQALVVMRATLDSTTDAILVTDEKVRVTDFNEKYLEMWKIPRESPGARAVGKNRGDSEPVLCGPPAISRSHRGNCRPPVRRALTCWN